MKAESARQGCPFVIGLLLGCYRSSHNIANLRARLASGSLPERLALDSMMHFVSLTESGIESQWPSGPVGCHLRHLRPFKDSSVIQGLGDDPREAVRIMLAASCPGQPSANFGCFPLMIWLLSFDAIVWCNLRLSKANGSVSSDDSDQNGTSAAKGRKQLKFTELGQFRDSFIALKSLFLKIRSSAGLALLEELVADQRCCPALLVLLVVFLNNSIPNSIPQGLAPVTDSVALAVAHESSS